MGDRIAIMRDGVLEQVGDPDEVYERPANTFVAGFIGSPAMSLARVGAERRNGSLELVLGDVRLALATDADVPAEVIVGARPEHTRLWDTEPGLIGPVDGSVDYVEALGRETLLGVSAAGGRAVRGRGRGPRPRRAGRGAALRAAPGLALPLRPRRRARARAGLSRRLDGGVEMAEVPALPAPQRK